MKRLLLTALLTATAAGAIQAQQVAAKTTDPLYSEGFERNLVMEEGTATWCGFCVAGMVMLEYINDTYPGRFFAISIHDNDRMACADYAEFNKKWFADGLPCSWTNRKDVRFPGTNKGAQTNEKFVNDMYAKYTASPAYCRVSAVCTADGENLKVVTTTEFSKDCNVEHRLNYVLTENGVGPYTQCNYYSDGTNGTMGGWENKPAESECMYDDVARLYTSYGGVEGSIPSDIRAGEQMSYTQTLPLNVFSGTDASKRNLIVFITNCETEEIVNACKVNLASTGVESAVAGTESPARYFTLQGVEVSEPSEGLFIRVAGGKSEKIYLRK